MQFYLALIILSTHINHTQSPHNGSNPAGCPAMLMRAKGIWHVTGSSGKLIHFHQHVKTVCGDSEGKKGDGLLIMLGGPELEEKSEGTEWGERGLSFSSLSPSLPPGLKKIPGASPSQIGTVGRYVLILFPALWRSHAQRLTLSFQPSASCPSRVNLR